MFSTLLRRYFAPGHRHRDRSCRTSGRWRRLWFDVLEDRTLPSAFYNLTTVASTAGGVFTDFGNLPALNNQGEVAFVADTSSGNGIWMSGVLPGQTLTNVTPTFDATDNGRTFGRGVSINDTNAIVAQDQLGTQFFVREWNGNTPDQHTDLFKSPEPVVGSPDDQFASAQNFTAINQNGAVAFVLYDQVNAVREVVTEPGNAIGDGTYSAVGIFNAQGAQVSPRPELTSTGQVLEASPGGQLFLAQSLSNRQLIAGGSNGFTEIDPGAAVSKDGRVVVFTGNRGHGAGLFAAYQSATGWQLVRLAGEGLDGFTSFDRTADVAVNNTWLSERGDTVVFQGTNQTLGTGIYSVRLSFLGDDPAAPDPISATSVYVSGVAPVALVGQALAGSTISAVELGQGINDVGRGQIAFWAQTADGNQDLVLANPSQVIYLNFSPPATVTGQTQTNAALFSSFGITALGWDGSLQQVLAAQGVTYSSDTVQTDVVNLVQQMYTNAGAAVTVLGLPGQAPPAYVPEPVTDASGNVVMDPAGSPITHGAFQTIYVGGDPLSESALGYASAPPAEVGPLDFYDQIPDSTALVFVNNLLHDPAYQGASPSSLSENQIVNGIAALIAHESGHNFGLFHLDPTATTASMINGTKAGEFDTVPSFSTTAEPVYPYTPDLANVTENSAKRLGYSTGAASGDPPNPVLYSVTDPSVRANIGFPAASTLNVQHLFVGVLAPFADTLPAFQDLGSGDLATLLSNADVNVNAADQLIVLGSSDGTSLDIVGVAQGQEGAQTSLSMTLLGLMTDSRLQAPVSGSGAALHFYQLTASGAVDLGLAPIGASAVPVLAPIQNQAVIFGSPITFTASATDAAPGATLTYSLGAGAPPGASIDPASGAFAWTPTANQAGQLYQINVVVSDNSTPPLTAAQPVTLNILNRLQALGVTELATPNPGPMQIAVDFNEALEPAPAQDVSNYQIVSQGGISLPIGSAVYSDNGSQHRVVLTIAAGASVIPDVYNVSVNAAQVTATNGDLAEQKADQLWVDVTSTNTLKPITVQPDGSFAAGPGQFLGYAPPQQVTAGSFTGSRYADLVVLTNSAGGMNSYPFTYADTQLLLLRNNGDGTYATPVPIPVGKPGDLIEYVGTVDWNLDGSPDLVVGTANAPFDQYGGPSSYSYYVLLNDGHGNFTNAPETPIPVAAPQVDNAGDNPPFTPFQATALFDLMGTGQPQIIHMGPHNSSTNDYNLEVIGKDRYLGYAPQMELDMPGTGVDDLPTQLAFADLNGDGKSDIIVPITGYGGGGGDVFLSTPTGYATGQSISDGVFGLVAGVGNYSGNGNNDIAAVTSDGVQIYRNDGEGNFTAPDPPIIFNDAQYIRAATFADLNDDGIPDLVVIIQPLADYGSHNGEPESVWTLLADGHGGFIPTTPAPIPIASLDVTIPTSIALVDMDGDGNPDLVVGTSETGQVRLAINDGTGTMRPPAHPLPFVGSANAVEASNDGHATGVAYKAFADFTNNGDLGFVTITPGGLDVYLGQSNGTFKYTTSLPAPPFPSVNSIAWVTACDVNNDGIPDILSGDGAGMAVYLGNGDGTFRQAPTFIEQATGYTIRNVTFADVNGDGNLDVVASLEATYNGGAQFPSAFGVLFGDGKGDFTFNLNTLIPVQVYPGGATNGYPHVAPALGDFNGDGKLDLLVPTESTANQTFSLTDYLGNGNGSFTPGPIVYSGAGGADDKILVGDLNGDGKLDLVAVNSQSGGLTASVYLGDGQGGFTKGSIVDVSVGRDGVGNPILPGGLALGDFSGDGHLDLAVSYYDYYPQPDFVDIYRGDGTGNFSPPQKVTVGANPVTLVSIPRAPFLDAGSFAVTDHGPVANNDQASVAAGASGSIPVLANDTDADGAPLTITAVGAPAHGTAHLDPTTGSIIYAPAPGFNGSDTFTYTLADPAGVTATATVTVSVVGISVTPTTLADATVNTKYTQQLTAGGGTAPYTFAVAGGGLPAGITLTAAGLLSGTPTATGTSSFSVTVTDHTGAAMTVYRTLTVEPPATAPQITRNPVAAQVSAGDTVSFSANASGVPAPAVQWQVSTDGGKTWTDVQGATSSSYTFTAQGAADGSQYRARFTNNGGTATTTAAKLTVTYAPVITSAPANTAAAPGTLVTFSAAASADPPVTGVQWQVSTDGGVTFHNLAGATSPVLTFTATPDDDHSEYQVTFTNALGATTSQPATFRLLTVVLTPLPPNSLPSIPVSWQDTTNPTAAGGETFDVLVSVNGGAWTPWLTQTPLTTASYPGQLGQVYAFYARADGAADAPAAFAETQTRTALWQYPLPAEPENSTAAASTTIATILQGRISDADPKTVPGVAVTQVSGNGAWQFNTGAGWRSFGTVTAVQARLVPQTARIRFLPGPGWTGEADLLFVGWDRALGAAGGTASVQTADGGAPFSLDAGEVSVQVTSTGTAPAWAAPTLTLPPVVPGAGASVVGTVTGVFGPAFGGGNGTVGIAVTSASAAWQYSRDGGQTWTAFGKVSARSARLLSGDDLLRIVPATQFAGTLTLTARAWDGTGADGSTVNLSVGGATGGNSDFSGNLLTESIAVNHAPILASTTGPSLGTVLENQTSSAGRVAALLAGAADPDHGTHLGIAVVGANGPGTWQYLVGGSWQTLGPVSEGAALLLPSSAKLRFVPGTDQTGTASVSYRAWDRTASRAGGWLTVSATGGASSLSATEASSVLMVASAPAGPTWRAGMASLTPVAPGDSQPPGDTVASVFGALFADADPSAGVGIAVVGLTGTAQGSWQYEQAGSTTWTALTGVSPGRAVLLEAGDRVRFVPSSSHVATAQLRALAWDGTGLAGTTVHLTGHGSTGAGTHFSATVATALVLVDTAPVLHT